MKDLKIPKTKFKLKVNLIYTRAMSNTVLFCILKVGNIPKSFYTESQRYIDFLFFSFASVFHLFYQDPGLIKVNICNSFILRNY